MTRSTVIYMLALVAIAGWLSPLRGASTETDDKAVGDQPARIIIQVNRNLEVAGHLALEDENVIAVRTPQGEVQSYAKSRVLRIVRLVDPVPGQSGMVILRDGQVREGIIIEDVFEHVLIEIHGIRAKLKRESISHVVLQPTFEQRYAEYKQSIHPGMYDAQFAMCKWLVEQNRYDLAQIELNDLLEKVEMHEARKLLTVVDAQLELRKPREPAVSEDTETTEGEPAILESEAETLEEEGPNQARTILTQQDVNLIRVYEIDFDRPPRITIAPDTVRAIIDNYGTSKLVPASQTGRTAMFRAAADQPLELVRLMFELRARDLYSQIQVNSEPHSLNQFRLRVHDTWLMNNCATTRCHGGSDAGRFFLHRKNYKDERVRYTNFMILERLQIDPEWPLINYDKPEDSLIIQYGLSREDPAARKRHPTVPGWKPAFSPINPRLRQEAIEWIESMMQPRPAYPVDFDPTPRDASGSPLPAENPAKPPR